MDPPQRIEKKYHNSVPKGMDDIRNQHRSCPKNPLKTLQNNITTKIIHLIYIRNLSCPEDIIEESVNNWGQSE